MHFIKTQPNLSCLASKLSLITLEEDEIKVSLSIKNATYHHTQKESSLFPLTQYHSLGT